MALQSIADAVSKMSVVLAVANQAISLHCSSILHTDVRMHYLCIW
jgi:hypothetical protein